MAAALQGLRFAARSLRCRPILNRYDTKPIGRRRDFSCTSSQTFRGRHGDPDFNREEKFDDEEGEEDDDYADDDENLFDGEEGEDDMIPKVPESDPEILRIMKLADRDHQARARREMEDDLDYMARREKFDAITQKDPYAYFAKPMRHLSRMAGYDPDDDEIAQMEEDEKLRRYVKPLQSFLNLGEEEIIEEEGDDELDNNNDEYDNMGPIGHLELEQHREMRHYARLAAWELPMLSSEL